VTVSIRHVTDLASLSDAKLTGLDRDLRQERLRRRGSWMTCARCGTEKLAKSGARYCSGRCRMAAFRATHRSQSADA